MIRTGGATLGITAFILLAGMTGTVYASGGSYETQCSGSLDLQIKDQNEGWRNGVTRTWVAQNMAPGQEFTFDGSFVGLRSDDKGRLSIGSCYTVTEESPQSEPDSDPFTFLHPDAMARQLILTSCLYKYGAWQINCLTGELIGATASERRSFDYCGKRWQIQDVDHDGAITFFDLKSMPLCGIPLPKGSTGARFTMGVRFASTAGNQLQGDTINLTMSYTLKPW